MSKPSAKDGDDARRIEEGVRVATTTELAHDSQEKDVTRQSIQEVDPDSHSDLSRSAGRPDVPDHYHNEMEGNSMVQKDRSRYHGSPIKRVYRAIATWISGPQPPRPFSINPFFPRFQSAPLRLLNTLLRGSRQRKGLYIVFCLVWLIIFASVLHSSVFGCSVPGFGSNVQRVSCSTKFWQDSTQCGLDGFNCHPFHNFTFAFRCPFGCADTQVVEPYTVGGSEINYQNVVIGGLVANGSMSVYRGDSFICASAIHTGIIDNAQGGAGVVSLVGEQHQFPSRSANGIQSIEFQPSFPVAFTFLNQSPAGQGPSNLCRDSRWNLLIVAVILTTLLSIFTTSPATLYFTTFVGAYFTVSLSTDPRSFKAFYSGISASIGDFLPCMFVCIVVYRYCILRTLSKLRAQIEKTILWLGGFWVGALSNYTFEKLPLQRLTPRDIQSQPGALPTVIIGAIVTLAVAVGQGWAFRREGRLPRFLAFYATTFIIIGLLAAVPGLNLRLHHYIMALILLPGTAIQTRPSLLYQGFLVGLFINGVARWGFDSILQTSSELFQLSLDPTEPKIPLPQIQGSNITFNWGKLPAGYDSMAILINDVMRFQGYEDHNPESFSWTRYREGEPEYFRFGYLKYGSTQGTAIGLYTNPGTWLPNGTWTPIKPRY